jgi:hypothetical protein
LSGLKLHTRRKLISAFCAALAMFLPVGLVAQSPQDVGELFASETTTHGPALLAGMGMSVASGAQVAAGKSVATLRLVRGGELRLCPDTSVTVSLVESNVQQRNQELMLSMDAGSIEFDYPVNDLADTLVTPDFKFMLAGPGVFHFALGVNNRGDTCIKPLRGNSASVIVSEMLGSGVYQVKPDEQLIFAGGKLSGRGALQGGCGCPTPAPVMRAESEQPRSEPPMPTEEPKPSVLAKSVTPSQPRIAPDVTAPVPSEKLGTLHMQVEAPLVFRGDQPGPIYAIAKIKFSTLPNVLLPQETEKPLVLKPGKGQPSANSKEKKGFFGRIKGFFSGLFHG